MSSVLAVSLFLLALYELMDGVLRLARLIWTAVFPLLISLLVRLALDRVDRKFIVFQPRV